MNRISFDMRGSSDAAIDAACLARRIMQALGLSVARGTVWQRGHEPIPENNRRKVRQFDLLSLDDIDADTFDAIADLWRNVGAVAGERESTPWQVCRANHNGGLPTWSDDVEAVRERDAEKCNGWRNWDTWNVVGAVDNVATSLEMVGDAAKRLSVQDFARWLLDSIEAGRLEHVGDVDIAKIDVRAIHARYQSED